MRYLTDGEHLYELVTERVIRNAGLGRPVLRYAVAVDCRTLEMLTLDEAALADCRPVIPAREVETCRAPILS